MVALLQKPLPCYVSSVDLSSVHHLCDGSSPGENNARAAPALRALQQKHCSDTAPLCTALAVYVMHNILKEKRGFCKLP